MFLLLFISVTVDVMHALCAVTVDVMHAFLDPCNSSQVAGKLTAVLFP